MDKIAEECIDLAIFKINLTYECLLFFICKIFSYVIIIFSFTLKFPQITEIIKKQSSKGLSTVSLYSDFYSVLFQGLYCLSKNFNPLIYIEYFTTAIQNFYILLLSWYYDKNYTTTAVKIKRITIILSTLFFIYISTINEGKYIPGLAWDAMIFSNIPFVTLSRISQMYLIIKTKQVGSVSSLSFFLRFFKNAMKVFVILFDSNNFSLIFNQFYNGFLSICMVFLIFLYKNKDSDKEKEKEKKN
jgi:hypothetical protein